MTSLDCDDVYTMTELKSLYDVTINGNMMLMMVDDVTEAAPLVHLQLASVVGSVQVSPSLVHVLSVQGLVQVQPASSIAVHASASSQTFAHVFSQLQTSASVVHVVTPSPRVHVQ